MANEHRIAVSVVYALPEQQWLFETEVERGTNALELVRLSGVLDAVGLDEQTLELGVYAQKITHDYLLEQGDRVEIYRPLLIDPKEARRQLALISKTGLTS